MIVVPVLMISCQVSEKWKIGPVIAQVIMTNNEMMKAVEVPTALVMPEEIFSNLTLKLLFFLFIFLVHKRKSQTIKPDFFPRTNFMSINLPLLSRFQH